MSNKEAVDLSATGGGGVSGDTVIPVDNSGGDVNYEVPLSQDQDGPATSIASQQGQIQDDLVRVVTTQPEPAPPPYEEVARSEGGTEEDRDVEALRMVEEFLAAAHLRQATGYRLNYGISCPCCPHPEIDPILGNGLFAVTAQGWRINVNSKAGCYCCCFPRAWRWNTATLVQNGTEVIKFIYQPDIWCPTVRKKVDIVDIYVPQKENRIGWIKFEGDIATIEDSMVKVLFQLVQGGGADDNVSMKVYLLVDENSRLTVAAGQGTRGERHRGFTTWKSFEMQCAPPAAVLPASSKAVILVAYIMWVFRYRERILRNRVCFILVSICLGLFIGLVASFSH